MEIIAFCLVALFIIIFALVSWYLLSKYGGDDDEK